MQPGDRKVDKTHSCAWEGVFSNPGQENLTLSIIYKSYNVKVTRSRVINPDWSLSDEDRTLAKWSLVLSATSNVPSTGPNSMVRDNRRSAAEISEHVVVCFDSTQTTPLDTT